ncbi:MAG TPA: YcnI family protein [Acidimicrobiales bacterium]
MASAHVIVTPGTAVKGASDVELSFRAPTESDTASTVGLDVQIPTDHPLLDVLVKQKPGWKVQVKTTKLAKPVTTDDGPVTEAVSEIIWTGGSVPPNNYDDFDVTVGQLPDDTNQIEFKAIQTYSDKSQVAWIEDTPKGGEEPEHPAPILQLTSASAAAGGSTATTAPAKDATPTVAVSAVSKSDVDSAKQQGTIGIVIGAVGVLIAAGAILLGRRRSASST